MLGGGGLLAAFPLAYAVVLPALYLPLIVMLLGADLPRRRLRVPLQARAPRAVWDWAFTGGSVARGLRQGVVLGAFIQGMPVVGRASPAARSTG